MEIANIPEADSPLSKLIDQAMNGEEVILARAGRPMVRLVPILADESPRVGGQWKGRVRIADDFDDLRDEPAAEQEAARRTTEETHMILLSAEDQRRLVDPLLDPPPLAPAMERAKEEHARLFGEASP